MDSTLCSCVKSCLSVAKALSGCVTATSANITLQSVKTEASAKLAASTTYCCRGITKPFVAKHRRVFSHQFYKGDRHYPHQPHLLKGSTGLPPTATKRRRCKSGEEASLPFLLKNDMTGLTLWAFAQLTDTILQTRSFLHSNACVPEHPCAESGYFPLPTASAVKSEISSNPSPVPRPYCQ